MIEALGKKCATGALAIAVAWSLTLPAQAQGLSSPISSCLVETRGAVNLGEFDSISDALDAAKARDASGGKFALATIASQKVAIDASRAVHPIVENSCQDSGPGMKPPE